MRSLLGSFCKQFMIFLKRDAPRFCHTLQCFGAIFEVRPSPESRKIEKKCLLNVLFFSSRKETHPVAIFVIWGSILGVFLEPRGVLLGEIRDPFSESCFGGRRGASGDPF